VSTVPDDREDREDADDLDADGAVVVIKAEAGAEEAAELVRMLLRMYLGFCRRRGWTVLDLEETPASDAVGLSRAVFGVADEGAFGILRGETGVHRLVRVAPSSGYRQTAFARVMVIPASSGAVAVTEDDRVVARFGRGEPVYTMRSPGQIRSYTLDPNSKVEDHRTGVETSEAARVLDGDLDLLTGRDRAGR